MDSAAISVLVDSFAKFLAGFEVGNILGGYVYSRARFGIAAITGWSII